MRVTLDTIAAKASVSASTVSRVLNNYEFVDEQTRNRVWEVARDLGYPLGRLRREPEITRSVLITGMAATNFQSTPEFRACVQAGVEAFMTDKGMAVRSQTIPTADVTDNFRHYASQNPGLQGLILLGGTMHHTFLESLENVGLPYVIVGGNPRTPDVNCVIADYLNGMEQAVNHLISRGRRRICLINGTNVTTTSIEKYKGFRLALTMHELPFAATQVTTANHTAEEGYEHALQLLEDVPDVDAIMCADDYIAVGVLHALQEANRRVPQDVAVVGFHNYSVAPFTNPPLTTIALEMHRMGVMAAQRLWDLICEPENRDTWTMLAPTKLLVRETT
jgi:DNA-binding LacI/PurR family transcriptional regulator